MAAPGLFFSKPHNQCLIYLPFSAMKLVNVNPNLSI